MLDSIYHMTLRFLKSNFCHKNVKIHHYVRSVDMDIVSFPKICKPVVNYRFFAWRFSTPRRDII